MCMLVMNLIQMEEHCQMSYTTTNNQIWLERKERASKLRQKYQEKLEKQEQSGQLHCFNKHTLSSAFRAWEIGDKHWRNSEKDEAIECYNDCTSLMNEFSNANWFDSGKATIGIKNKISKFFSNNDKEVQT